MLVHANSMTVHHYDYYETTFSVLNEICSFANKTCEKCNIPQCKRMTPQSKNGFHITQSPETKNVDGQTDVGHINLIGGLVTRNPPKNACPCQFNDSSPL